MQSVWSNCCCSCGVTQFGSLASVGFAVGVAAGDAEPEAVEPPEDVFASGDAVGVGVGLTAVRALGMFMPLLELLGDGLAVWLAVDDELALGLLDGVPAPDDEGVGVPVALGAGSPTCSAWSTARNCSWADCSTSWMVFWSGLPGDPR